MRVKHKIPMLPFDLVTLPHRALLVLLNEHVGNGPLLERATEIHSHQILMDKETSTLGQYEFLDFFVKPAVLSLAGRIRGKRLASLKPAHNADWSGVMTNAEETICVRVTHGFLDDGSDTLRFDVGT